MILPTFKEEQILNELLTDYAEVKRDVRKSVKKRQRAAQKKGHTIRNGSVEVLTTRTKNGNNWVCCVYYERDRQATWNLSACCEAEGGRGRKDYYLLRGLSDQPYFIKLTSHAVRRYKERQVKTDMFCAEGNAAFPCTMFACHEIGICNRYIDDVFFKALCNIDIVEDVPDLSHLIFTASGIFFAYKSALGNYTFRTFITHQMVREEFSQLTFDEKGVHGSKQAVVVWNALMCHQYYNKWMYPKEIIDKMLYTAFSKDVMFHLTNQGDPCVLRP